MKNKKTTLEDLIKERDQLYVSGNNPKRLNELIDKINYLFWGIKKN